VAVVGAVVGLFGRGERGRRNRLLRPSGRPPDREAVPVPRCDDEAASGLSGPRKSLSTNIGRGRLAVEGLTDLAGPTPGLATFCVRLLLLLANSRPGGKPLS
jgi:hypothetical protein